MRVFTSTLLADLSAHDLAERLGERFSVETLAAKLEQLKTWGNLMVLEAALIAEGHDSSSTAAPSSGPRGKPPR